MGGKGEKKRMRKRRRAEEKEGSRGVTCPSHLSESLVRVTCPSHWSESLVRVGQAGGRGAGERSRLVSTDVAAMEGSVRMEYLSESLVRVTCPSRAGGGGRTTVR